MEPDDTEPHDLMLPAIPNPPPEECDSLKAVMTCMDLCVCVRPAQCCAIVVPHIPHNRCAIQ